MTIEMLIYDFRESEKPFFENNEFQNFKFTFFEESLNTLTVKKLPQEVKEKTTIVSVFTNSDITEEVVNEFPNLRIISTRSTDYSHISKHAAISRNIAVLNVTNYGETPVAQFTFCLILALVRKLFPAINGSENLIGHNLSELSLGIVGTGSIGASVCKITQSFGMKILGYDINPKQELIEKYNIEYLPFEDLLKNSDIVTLHLPYTGDNYHMFDNSQFDMMKNGAYFINTSSKKLVNLKSLYEAVKSGKLAGVGLDNVQCYSYNEQCCAKDHPTELCNEEYDYLVYLKELENVIVTPHIAYNTAESVEYILQNTFENIRNAIEGGNVYGVY